MFVSCSSADEQTGNDVFEKLCERRFKCATEFDGVSHPGCAIRIKANAEVIANSKHVVFIFSKNSCSGDCIYQLILTLEQLQHRSGNDVVIRILLDGVQPGEVPLSQKGFLADLLKGQSGVCINYDDQGAWVPELIDSLKRKMILFFLNIKAKKSK